MKKLLFTLIACVLALGLVGGAFAYFSDTETSTGNTFTAGTLDLKVDSDPAGGSEVWVDDPDFSALVASIAGNLKPGDSADILIGIKNAGTIDGTADFKLTVTADLPGTNPEPEGTPDSADLATSIIVAIDYNDTWVSGYAPSDGNTLSGISGTNIVLGDLNGGATASISVHLEIPGTVGNEIQGDTCTVDVEFSLNQK